MFTGYEIDEFISKSIKWVDINYKEDVEIAREALKLLRASLPTTIDIKHDIQNKSTVLADPTQIHQVLMNICTNASHAMQEKGGTLEIRLNNVELDSGFTTNNPDMKSGSYLKLSISDTGCGMPPEILERLILTVNQVIDSLVIHLYKSETDNHIKYWVDLYWAHL